MNVEPDPASAVAALAAASSGKSGAIDTDAVIVGAGPVGLFQAFELGLLEIKAHIVDSLACPGGQCIELYPDKPIYDIPGVPICTGRQLVDNLLAQIRPFGTPFHLEQEVTELRRQADGRFLLQTSKGTRFIAKTVFIAGGVGAFQPRTLKLDGLDNFLGQQLFYSVPDPQAFAGKKLVIVGGGDAALDWALNFVADGPHKAESVVLVHRRDGFRAAPASVARMRQQCEAGKMQLLVGQITGFEVHTGRLAGLQLTGNDGAISVLPMDRLLVLLGLSPKLGPIAEWGLGLDHRQIVVDTEKFETSVRGVFAVGDINTYPGKKKLILSGFHEAALAAFGAAAHVFPDQRVLLQYTTTSPRLHKLLGVEPPLLD
jgi:thioredoxin reductase (NADPH)